MRLHVPVDELPVGCVKFEFDREREMSSPATPAGLRDDFVEFYAVIRRALIEAVDAGGVTLIHLCTHQFSPQGVTATATLAESHIAIHTWPEHGYFGADFFFCGSGHPYRALETLCQNLQAGEFRTTEIKRGPQPSARPASLAR